MSIIFSNSICQKDKICDANLKILSNFVSPYNATVVEKLADLKVNTDVTISNKIDFKEGFISIRPTHGLISRYGLISDAVSFDTIGIVSKKIDDMLVVLEKIAGKDFKDPSSTENKLENEISSPKIDKNFKLNNQEYLDAAFDTLYLAEYSTNLAYLDGVRYGVRAKDCKDWEDVIRKSRTEGFDDETKRKLIIGTVLVSAKWADEYYVRAKTIQNKIIDEFNKEFEKFDIIETSVEDKAPLFAGLPSLFINNKQYVGKKYSEKTLLKFGGSL